MANTSAAKKAVRVQERKRRRNAIVMSSLKTAKKTALLKIQSNNPEEARAAVLRAISRVDKALAKGIVHRNQAARNKSRFMKKLTLLLKPGNPEPGGAKREIPSLDE